MVLSLGVPAERLSFGNTIKKARDAAYFYQKEYAAGEAPANFPES
jgi:diaminopimelate decarboxylase